MEIPGTGTFPSCVTTGHDKMMSSAADPQASPSDGKRKPSEGEIKIHTVLQQFSSAKNLNNHELQLFLDA